INLCRFLFVTKKAMMKIVSGGEFDVVKRTIQATSLQEGDSVMKVAILSDQVNVVLQTQKGYFIKFPMDQIPEKKKNAVGVRGMKLTEDDELEEVYFTKNLETTTIRYKDKDVDLNHLKLSSRDGRGAKIRV
ncbi:MAG: DNA gyrase C-terminal beta-propeller domain-containing protein, partial [Lachnospiraceae bacterium]|nr:DNA gyrase C-terminal beta-propeller domain-containing protein [Lachnospiraceae bacterium]